MYNANMWNKFSMCRVNTLRPRQNGRHFPDDIFKCIFLNENARTLIKISLKFVPHGPINRIPALVQIMAWRQSGDKPLSEPMMVSLLTHICVTRPQWVKLSTWCYDLVMVATLLEILILLYFFVAVIYHSLDLWCWTWANDIHNSLTHWGRVTHICVSKLTIIGSDNGLASGQRQTIIWTNAGMLLIGPLGINNEILIRIHTFSFKKIRLKMLSVKCCPLRLNVLLGAEQATSHYLNQCWPSSLTHICVTGGEMS